MPSKEVLNIGEQSQIACPISNQQLDSILNEFPCNHIYFPNIEQLCSTPLLFYATITLFFCQRTVIVLIKQTEKLKLPTK